MTSVPESLPFDLAALRAVPLFQDCSDDEVARLGAVVCRLRLPACSVLGTQGEPFGALVLIVDGEAEVMRDGRVVDRLSSGDHLGSSSLLVRSPGSFSVVAASDVIVDRVSALEFRRLVMTTPALAWPLLVSLAGLSADHSSWR